MAEQLVEGLSGTEIIDDVLDQIRRKLIKSCDLRESDSYDQGYSGSIEIHLKLHSMESVPVDIVMPIMPIGEPPVSTEETIVTPVDVDEKVEIEQELDLESVRDRIKDISPVPEPTEEEENRMPTRLKRRYTRRTPIETPDTPAEGAAVDLDEKF